MSVTESSTRREAPSRHCATYCTHRVKALCPSSIYRSEGFKARTLATVGMDVCLLMVCIIRGGDVGVYIRAALSIQCPGPNTRHDCAMWPLMGALMQLIDTWIAVRHSLTEVAMPDTA